MPNGPLGVWMTKKSKSVVGGSPSTRTCISSTAPRGSTRTVAWAFGTQAGKAASDGERTMSKLKSSSACTGEASAAKATATSDPAMVGRVLDFMIFLGTEEWRESKRTSTYGLLHGG